MNRRSFQRDRRRHVDRPLAQCSGRTALDLWDSGFDPWIEIKPEHLRRNVEAVAQASATVRSLPSSRTTATDWGLFRLLGYWRRSLSARTRGHQAAGGVRDSGRGHHGARAAHGTVRAGGDLPELHARDIMPMVYTQSVRICRGWRARPLNQDSRLHRYRAWARRCAVSRCDRAREAARGSDAASRSTVS